MSKAKHNARRRAVQALYSWRMTGNDLSDVELLYLSEQDMSKANINYFKELLHQAPKLGNEFEAVIKPLLDRKLEEVDPVELAILEIAYYELVKRLDIPYRVVINESVELAKVFGAEESYKFINGIVDKLAGLCRKVEVQATAKKRLKQ
jgi:N utilization substance protein B